MIQREKNEIVHKLGGCPKKKIDIYLSLSAKNTTCCLLWKEIQSILYIWATADKGNHKCVAAMFSLPPSLSPFCLPLPFTVVFLLLRLSLLGIWVLFAFIIYLKLASFRICTILYEYSKCAQDQQKHKGDHSRVHRKAGVILWWFHTGSGTVKYLFFVWPLRQTHLFLFKMEGEFVNRFSCPIGRKGCV